MQQSDDNYWDKYINSFNMNYIPKKEKPFRNVKTMSLKAQSLFREIMFMFKGASL